MRVAVTGGAGYIGARARGLLDGGRHPRGRIFTRRSPQRNRRAQQRVANDKRRPRSDQEE